MSKDLKIITTDDGSHSLYNAALNETYHSFHGAIQESDYVFIQRGLADYCRSHPEAKTLRVFEVGMGTGLNVLMAAIWAQAKHLALFVDTIEAFPLDKEMTDLLNFSDYVDISHDPTILKRLHSSEWGEKYALNDFLTLTKIHAQLENHVLPSEHYDVIFFDAFAPNKQPDLWTVDILTKMYEALTVGGIFVTYCAKGQLKRDLADLGFTVETLPGPPGKKEMVRAIK